MKNFIISLILLAFASVRGQSLSPITPGASSVNFAFTGAVQTFTVPSTLCVSTVTFVVRGAKGGGGGGLGAAIQATYAVTPGQVFQIMVGGAGTQGAASGGFNGGGTGQASTGNAIYSSFGGGGASDVRVAPFALANRILVAGGGGGAGGGSSSACGGAANCNNGLAGCNTYGSGGGGGTQIAGGTAGIPWAATPPGGSPGTLGVGGQGGPWQTASGGGGGGGYYGGGGGGNDGCCTGANGGGGGGGGSSFYPAGSLCSPAAQNGNGSVTVYYLPGINPTVIESYAMCSRSAPALNTLSLSAQITTTAAGVLTFSWTGPGGFNSVVNSTAVAVNPASTPTVGSYMTQSTPGPGTVITTQFLFSPNPTPLASGIYTVYAGSNGTVGACASTVQVMVNQTPTISVFGVNAPACQGTTLNFSLTPINPTVAVAGQSVSALYSWLGPNSFASNTQSPSIVNSSSINAGTYSATAVYNYTQSLASTVFTTAANTPLIFTSTLTCKKDTSLLAVIINTALPSSANYTLCPGANLTLNTSIAIQPTTFSWVGPGTYTSSAQSPLIANVTPVNSGNYSLTALFTSPATTLVCSATSVSNLSVVPTSPVAVTVPNNLCQFTTANISALAPGAIGYSWVGPNNFTSNLQATSISNIQPASSGVYFSTATFAIGTVSCTTTGSNQINVVPVNPIVVTPTISICEPANAQLSSSSNGAATYSWTGPNNFNAQNANPTLYYSTPSLSGIYTITTSYNNGSLICFNTNTTQLIVNPRLTFTLIPYKQMCYNSLLNINGPAGATSYSWTSSTGFTSNSQNLTIAGIQPNQSGSYTLNVSLGPCVTTQKIDIDVLSPLSFTLTPQNRTICRGDSVELIAGSTGGSQNYAYVWSPGVFLASPTGSVQYGHPIGTTIYNLGGYDIACPNYTVFHTFTIQVNQPPVIDLQLDKQQGCEPLCLFYNTKSQNTAAITTYDFGGTKIMQADSFSYCLNEPGTYNLRITSVGKNGCKGTYDHPMPIVVWPKPHSDFNWNPDVVTTSNNQVTFNPMAKYGPITSINWMFTGTGINGFDTSNVQNPQRVFENAGKFPIMLIQRTDHACVDSTIKNIEIIEDFNVYIPNGFTPNGDGLNDMFLIKGLGFKPEGFSMELFDRWGNSLFFSKDYTKGWDGTVKGIQSQDGVYIYKIRVVGANGEGRKEYIGHVTLMK
ncbi:MAG: gliding motility-associated C-terminal domain-containing protein [Bacteroidetes bacterium]|nr:gliding motility-associated C-terminal domain-containing protein [Bacteroidota bacterium]